MRPGVPASEQRLIRNQPLESLACAVPVLDTALDDDISAGSRFVDMQASRRSQKKEGVFLFQKLRGSFSVGW